MGYQDYLLGIANSCKIRAIAVYNQQISIDFNEMMQESAKIWPEDAIEDGSRPLNPDCWR